MNLHLDAPDIGELEKIYVSRTIDSGFVSTFGPYVPDFEKKFSDYIGTGRAVSTQSGTAALHVALYELGIGPGDEVIVPALTFVATVNPVMYVGAKPVFVDVDNDSWDIDPVQIERNITPKTRAIIPVHLYGNPSNLDRINEIAKKRDLFVIEDATESLGASYKSKFTGCWGDLGCFSFNGNKTITTGGGGMIVGRDIKVMDHIKFLVNQARDEERGYYHPEIGFNYRMTNIEASMGMAQMEKLTCFLDKKRSLHEVYTNELSGEKRISFQKEYEGARSSWWFNCICIDGDIDLGFFQTELRKSGVPTRRVFMPITEFPPYKAFSKAEMLNSMHIYERGLCLPSSTLNSEKDIAEACRIIRKLL